LKKNLGPVEEEQPEIEKDSKRDASMVSHSSGKSWKEDAVQELTKIEVWFDTTFNTFVFKFRYIILLAGFLMAAYAGIRSTEVSGLTRMEDYFKPDHIVMISFNKTISDFNEGDQGQAIMVDIMWGVEGINKTGVDFFNAS